MNSTGIHYLAPSLCLQPASTPIRPFLWQTGRISRTKSYRIFRLDKLAALFVGMVSP